MSPPRAKMNVIPVQHTPESRHPIRAAHSGPRHGAVTLWAILAIPAAIMLLGVVVEITHLWLARAELQASLEAGALAGVKRWADLSTQNDHETPGDITITHAARIAAQAAAAGNTVAGQPVLLDLNEQDDGDDQTGFDNASCEGDILLGGFPTSESTIFTTAADVGCGRSEETTLDFNITFNIEVDTLTNSTDNNTSNVADAFRVGFTTATPGISLTQVEINLQNGAMGAGVFHPNPVQPDLTFSGNEATGNGPTVHASSDVPAGNTSFNFNPGNTVMTIDVTPGVWTSGETLVFGVDTDGVRVSNNPGMPPPADVDTGGNFGSTGGGAMSTAGEVLFSFSFTTAGGTSPLTPFDKSLQRLGVRRSELLGVSQNFQTTISIVIPDVDFAVMTQKTVPVTPLFKQIFGIPISDYNVSGMAIATARCEGDDSVLVENPQSVFFTGVNCP
jgi:hypothetical protein